MSDLITTKPKIPLATLLICLSTPGVLAQIGYHLVDEGLLLERLREPLKKYVDHNFLSWAALVFPSILVFSVCILFKLMEWARTPRKCDPSRHTIARRIVYVVSFALLILIGFMIGHNGPICWVLIQTGSLQFTVWSAPVLLLAAGLATEQLFARRIGMWLRPLVWSAFAGSLVLLVHLLLIDWEIDLAI